MAQTLTDIEQAGSRLQMCSALAKDPDRLVTNAINWYSCLHPNLSPTLIRQRQRLIRDAVGDYLYVAGSNLKAVVESLPDDYNQELLARVAAEQLSQLIAQLYPELKEAMQRAGITGKQPTSPTLTAKTICSRSGGHSERWGQGMGHHERLYRHRNRVRRQAPPLS